MLPSKRLSKVSVYKSRCTRTYLSDFFKDTRYKKYVLLVERNLQLFDSVSEWADFIAFLSRLVKVRQGVPCEKCVDFGSHFRHILNFL